MGKNEATQIHALPPPQVKELYVFIINIDVAIYVEIMTT